MRSACRSTTPTSRLDRSTAPHEIAERANEHSLTRGSDYFAQVRKLPPQEGRRQGKQHPSVRILRTVQPGGQQRPLLALTSTDAATQRAPLEALSGR